MHICLLLLRSTIHYTLTKCDNLQQKQVKKETRFSILSKEEKMVDLVALSISLVFSVYLSSFFVYSSSIFVYV